jgi:hypothetical protein
MWAPRAWFVLSSMLLPALRVPASAAGDPEKGAVVFRARIACHSPN